MYKMILQIIAGTLLMLILGIIVFVNVAPQFGARSKDERLNKIIYSANYRDGKFQNLVPTTMSGENTSMWKNGLKFMKKDKSREPDKVLETAKFNANQFIKNDKGIVVSWFGHSSLLINLNGKIVLTDPVFSETASPVSFMGVKRFAYSNQYNVEDLPEIDVVLISHDHYDHLDYPTIKKLKNKTKKFYVPLGVAAHLIRWGVDENKIVELDWWENNQFDEKLNFTSTPGRHFSGRKGVDKDYTLWCSWVIESVGEKVFYCGDSGYGGHFKQIGEKFGSFDLTLMECGQYNEGWPYIHMMPEQSVQAHIDLNGKTMIPIHWGKFKLSLHKWTEPIERARKEAERLSVSLLSPTPGEIIEIKTEKDKTGSMEGKSEEMRELVDSK
jgi:L-ascorbate metabolism protein UlaG (beta-lactamase superfamily)